MTTPTNGPKNAPKPRPASPAPITPPSRKASPVVQSLQVLALYAALVAVVCLLVTTCSRATAQTIAPRHAAGYPDPARESDGPDFGESGKDGRTARTCCGFFVRDFRPRPRYGKAGGDTREGMPVTYLSGSPTPSVLPPYLAKGGRTSTQDRSLNHGI